MGAAAALDRAWSLGPPDEALALDRAMAHGRTGDIARTLEVYGEGVEALPDAAVLHSRYGQYADMHDSQERSLALHRRAVALAPDDAELWMALASSARKLGALAEAEAGYRRALELGMGPSARAGLVQALLAKGNVDEALGHARSLFQASKKTPADRLALASVLVRAAAHAEAVPHLEAVMEVAPRHADARMSLLECQLALRRYGAARANLESWLELAPENGFAIVQLASILAADPDRPDPRRALELADGMVPHLGSQRPEVHLARAASLAHLGRASEACAAGQDAQRLDAAGDIDDLHERLEAWCAGRTWTLPR